MPPERQFSIAYLLAEVALVAVALAFGRIAVAPSASWLESQAMCYCIALAAGCGAIGGAFLRMAVGLVGGGVFAVASIPLVCLALGAA
jgi:hypothetical protein